MVPDAGRRTATNCSAGRPAPRPAQVSAFNGDVGGFRVSPSGDHVVVWADRDLRCADLDCAGLPAKPTTGSGRTYDMMFIRHWDTWATPGVRSRLFGFRARWRQARGQRRGADRNLVGDTPSKPFGGSEEIALSPDGRTVYFALARGGPDRALVDQPRHFRRADRRQRPPVNLTDANDGTDNCRLSHPTDGRWLISRWRGPVTRPTARC